MAATPAVLRSRVLARTFTSSLRRGLLGSHAHPPSSLLAASPRPSAIHRLPSVCGGLLSVMPLHSAVASARLQSAIAHESQSWGVVPQVLNVSLGSAEELFKTLTRDVCVAKYKRAYKQP